MGELGWETWVAIYAAVVSTAAVLLELFFWLRRGPRLNLSLMSRGILINSPLVDADERFLFVTASNVGDRQTTVTNLGLVAYTGWFWWWRFLRRRASKAAVVTNPAIPGQKQAVPSVLAAGDVWQGMVEWAAVEELCEESEWRVWVILYTSDHSRGIRSRISRPTAKGLASDALMPSSEKQ